MTKIDSKYPNPPKDPYFKEFVKTPLTEKEIAYYLRRAFEDYLGYSVSADTVAIAWAQVVLETGRNSLSLMRNHNWGNIKKNMDYSPFYTSYECGEYIKGKHIMFYSYHPETFFAAWESPLEGAVGYLKFLSKRVNYVKAWPEMLKGNTVDYVRELKAGGYFTAPLDKYTALVVKLVKEFKSKPELMTWEPVLISEPQPEPEPKVIPKMPDISVPGVDIDFRDLSKVDQKGLISVLMMIWSFILKLLKK